jgi:hypothetical protein
MLDGEPWEKSAMRISNLAWAILVTLAILPTAYAGNDGGLNLNDNTQADRALEGMRLDTIHLAMEDSYATLTQIVVVTPDCAFRGDTAVTRRRNVNKVGITQDMPFIGEFFADTPRQGELNTSNQLGLAYLEGSTLYVDLRSGSPTPTANRSLLDALVTGPTGGQSAPFAANSAAPPLAGFSVVNRNFQFQVPKANFSAVAPAGTACGKDAMTRLPPLAPLFAKPVGSVHLLTGQLIVLVRPSIIAGY